LVIGLDQILKMGCSKGKEGIWNQIRSGNQIVVLIWIKASVCVVQNLIWITLIQKNRIILIQTGGRISRWISGRNWRNWSNNTFVSFSVYTYIYILHL